MHDSHVASAPFSGADTEIAVVSQVQALAVRSADWPCAFNRDALERFLRITIAGPATPHMRALAKTGLTKTAKFPPDAITAIFGDIGASHHSFRHPSLDWLRLTEPMATQAIANLLDKGEESVRNKRLHAFLRAIETPDLPENPQDYSGFRVATEQDRIDLDIRLPILNPDYPDDPRIWRPILVEAKFDHPITPGQLDRYCNAMSDRGNVNMNCAHFVLLALTAEKKRELRGKQKNRWNVVSWRDMWLKFESGRPQEDNPDLAIFLHSLWRRIGGLNPKDAR